MKTSPDELGDFTNSRGSQRKPFTALLEVRLPTGTTYGGVARDLGEFGIGAIVFADTKVAKLQVGDEVTIAYTHPGVAGDTFVERRAYVTGRYGNRYGFRFERSLEIASGRH